MSFIYKKSIQHFQNEDGHRKTAFSIMKDKNGTIQKINGIGNGETFHIKETIAKNLTGNRTKFAVHEKVYKMRASNIKSLLNESKSKSSNKVKNSPKKTVTKSVLKNKVTKTVPKSDLKKKVTKVDSKSDLKKKVTKIVPKSDLKKVTKTVLKSDLKKKLKKVDSKNDLKKVTKVDSKSNLKKKVKK